MGDFRVCPPGSIHRPAPAQAKPLVERVGITRLTFSATRDWLSLRPADNDALGNDRAGNCCECADLRHAEIVQSAMGSAWKPTADMALARYARVAGYDPTTGQPDNGTDATTDMTDWCNKGIAINEQFLDIPAWCPVNPGLADHIAFAIDRTGPVLATLALPTTWRNLSTWASAPGTGASWAPNSAGEHRVLIGAYKAAGGPYVVRTWGLDVLASGAWLAAYLLAVDAVPSLAWFNARPELEIVGMPWQEMAADMAALIG